MKDTVTLKELLAIVVRRGMAVVLAAVVLAALLGGYRGVSLYQESKDEKNSPEKIEERYQEAMKAYKVQREAAEEELALLQQKLDRQRDYMENSLLMQIDPLNKCVTTSYFSIVGLDPSDFQQVYEIDGTPEDYILNRITEHYRRVWETVDMEDILNKTAYGDMDEKYLREVVAVGSSGSGIFAIVVTGESESVTRAVTDKVYAYLESQQSVISEGSYDHAFSEIAISTKTMVDEELETRQRNYAATIASLEEQVEAKTKALEDMMKPEKEKVVSAGDIVKSAVKYAFLGAVAGAVLACAFLLVLYLFQNRVESSFQLEQGLEIPFFGSLAVRGSVWNYLANCILGERIWKDQELALAYISENVKVNVTAGKKLLVMTTLPSVKGEQWQKLEKSLQEKGIAVSIVENAAFNPATVTALKDCDGVILAERVRISGCTAVSQVCAQAKAQGKAIYGFVMV